MKKAEAEPVIAIIGAGYVGISSAAIFAAAGFKVRLLDTDKSRIDQVNQGRAFFYEAHIDELIATGLKSGKLHATTDYTVAIPDADYVFSAVGTPDYPDGSSNLDYVVAAAKEAAKYIKDGAIYVQKSTVPVGTGKVIRTVFPDSKHITYVSNPEFLREGSAVLDTLYFDRVVAGSENTRINEKVIELYRHIDAARPTITKNHSLPKKRSHKSLFINTTLESAELIKVVSNAFLALKISFANSIALLADKVDADVVAIMDGVGADKRIGRAFLNASRGYGGGCFPKDVSGLIASAASYGVDLHIMQAAQEVNEHMPHYVVHKTKKHLADSLTGKDIAVLGLSFKANTSDARKSSGVKITNTLIAHGSRVRVYDPHATNEASEFLHKAARIAQSIEEAVKDADAVIITTDWHHFKDIAAAEYAKLLKGTLFVDAMNCFHPHEIKAAGLEYVGVGRSAYNPASA